MEHTQRVYLLRHGQSTFNAAYALTGIDPILIDARLSDLGRQQVAEVSNDVQRLDLELIVTSPLTRCLETAVAMVRGHHLPIMVHPLLRERRFSSCDIGRDPATLAANFPTLDFSHLEDVWWYVSESNQPGDGIEPIEKFGRRVADFCDWLKKRSESSILVVGHADFFACLTGVKLKNCELRAWNRSISD